MPLKTRMTAKFAAWGIRVPVMNGPMAGAAGGALAAAVAKGGGLPFIAAGHAASEETFAEEVQLFRTLTSGMNPTPPLCIGFITYSSLPRQRAYITRFRPDVVQFFAPAVANDEANIKLARELGVGTVIAQVGNMDEAQAAVQAGVDVLIVQGSEAGGHGLRPAYGSSTLPLAASVCSWLKREGHTQLVFAAGGIVDGRGLTAALSLGCDGVSMGTRFYATFQAIGLKEIKGAITQANCDDAIRTRVFDCIQNTYSDNPWPAPYDSVGAFHNATSREWEGRLRELDEILGQEGSKCSIVTGYRQKPHDPSTSVVLMGQGAGDVHELEDAEEVVRRVEREAVEAAERVWSMVEHP